MKKIIFTFILLIPALLATAQGPIKTWNDQLDDFITVFNGYDSSLNQLNSDNGISAFIFTYFEPESGNVVKEASVFDNADFEKVDDTLLQKAKDLSINNLRQAAKEQNRIRSIINEFAKRGTNIVILYSTPIGETKATKQVVISPSDIL